MIKSGLSLVFAVTTFAVIGLMAIKIWLVEPVKIATDFSHKKSVVVSEYVLTDYKADAFLAALLKTQVDVILLRTTKGELATHAHAREFPILQNPKVRRLNINHDSPWMRDYLPVFVREESSNPKFVAVGFVANRQSANPDLQVASTLAGLKRIAFRQLGYPLDGGSFMSDGKTCWVAEMSYLNRKNFAASDKVLGCKKMVFLKNLPHPHLDMVMMAVAPGRVLVSEYKPVNVSGQNLPRSEWSFDELQLESQLNLLARKVAEDAQVIRLPIPKPIARVFRTYTNSLLLNGVAILPRYEKLGWRRETYDQSEDLKKLENKVAKVYQRLGFRVEWVNADLPIFNGGAWHCLAVALPIGMPVSFQDKLVSLSQKIKNWL